MRERGFFYVNRWYSISELSALTKIPYQTLASRLYKQKMTVEQAVKKGLTKSQLRKRMI